MTREPDIVARLREYARNCGRPPEEYLAWQAADELARLRAEVAEWKERWAAERRDHETTIRHFEELMNEMP